MQDCVWVCVCGLFECTRLEERGLRGRETVCKCILSVCLCVCVCVGNCVFMQLSVRKCVKDCFVCPLV